MHFRLFLKATVLISLAIGAVSYAQPQKEDRELFLKVVASVANHVINSREVEASYIIDKAMYGSGSILPVSIKSDEFREAINRLLIEWMVFEEAKVFNVAAVSDSEITQMVAQVKQKTASGEVHGRWRELAVSDSDLREIVLRKLRANKFIKYKSNSSYVQVSDEEARDYFNKNRLKFGTMEFEKFRENIKVFLAKTNAQTRLRDWFEILRKKHNVKNLMVEGERDASS